MLERAALGRQARLWYGGLSRDRYERAIAHVIARDEVGPDVWLNGLAVRQGAARPRIYPDNATRARRLLAIEDEAWAAKRDLWAEDHWRVRRLDDLSGAPNFAAAKGIVASIGARPGDGDAHLAAGGIRSDAGERLGVADVDVRVGAKLRVRGRVDMRPVEADGDAVIRVTHWA